MSPTLSDGQWVLVLRGEQQVRPGDVAVFVSPLDRGLAVKRCILEDNKRPQIDHGWLVTPWGRWYLTGDQWRRLDAVQAPEDTVFMVGDNQFQSLDSRSYGFVPRDNIVGRVILSPGRRRHG